MKTLVRNNISVYIFEDNKALTISENNIEVGDPLEFIISDCNSSNTTLYTGVTSPDDWKGNKYLFDGTNWTENSKWVDSDG